jgi:hypothetical protein
MASFTLVFIVIIRSRIGSGISRAGSWIGPEADCGVRAVEDRQRVGSADDPG